MDAYHGTHKAVSESIKAQGLIGKQVYITLDLQTAEHYAYIRAKQSNDIPCIVSLTLPDSWQIVPDGDTDDEQEAYICQSIPAQFISDIQDIAQW